jgi:two-component system nitrogen regulation response regulator NtrX
LGSDRFERVQGGTRKVVPHGKLAENDWNVSETARKLDMPRSNLYKKIEKYGLSRERES